MGIAKHKVVGIIVYIYDFSGYLIAQIADNLLSAILFTRLSPLDRYRQHHGDLTITDSP